MKRLLSQSLILLSVVGLIFGCQNEQDPSPNTSSSNPGSNPNQSQEQEPDESYVTFATLDNIWDALGEEANQAYADTIDSERKSFGREFACVSFELLVETSQRAIPGFETYVSYNQLIIDFDGEACQNDLIASGKIEIYFAGGLENRWKDSIVFKNLELLDGNKVDGYKTTAFVPELSQTSARAYTTTIDGNVTLADGSAYTWNSSVLEKRIDPLSASGIIEREGITTYADLNTGFTLTSTTAESLQRKAACEPAYRYTVKGKQDFTDNGFLNFSVDFGEGDCDNIATFIPPFGEPFDFEL